MTTPTHVAILMAEVTFHPNLRHFGTLIRSTQTTDKSSLHHFDGFATCRCNSYRLKVRRGKFSVEVKPHQIAAKSLTASETSDISGSALDAGRCARHAKLCQRFKSIGFTLAGRLGLTISGHMVGSIQDLDNVRTRQSQQASVFCKAIRTCSEDRSARSARLDCCRIRFPSLEQTYLGREKRLAT